MSEPDATVVRRVLADILPATATAPIERVRAGVSTWVYRVVLPTETLYLRVLPEPDASMLPEALAHGAARARGVLVPEVVAVAHHSPALDRSLMLTSAIPGRPLSIDDAGAARPAVLRAAGKALARINAVPVEGWGWVRRDAAATDALRAEHASWHAWRDQYRAADLAALQGAGVLDAAEASAVDDTIRRCSPLLDDAPARLAHGDFDPTHIYHQDGRFSGIIDFGEIRGAHPLYDLGHFTIESPALLPDLLAGYLGGAAVTPELLHQISLLTLLIALRRLSRHVERGRTHLYAPDRAALLRSVVELKRASCGSV